MSKTLITYAQNREDLYLWALLGHRNKGFYVDVGAHNPQFHSVTKLFYDRGWRGINVEPNPELYKQFLKERRRDVNLNLGAANSHGKLRFRTYPNHKGFSTFSDLIMQIHEEEGIPYEDVKVPVKPLREILKQQKAKAIDFMSIDVEGYEIEVIEGNDWTKFRPSVLIIEATVGPKLKPILKNIGYKLEFFDGLNNYYLDKSGGEPLTIYNYAPKILGTGYYTKNDIIANERIAALEKQVSEMSRFKNQPKNLSNATRRVIKSQAVKIRNILRQN